MQSVKDDCLSNIIEDANSTTPELIAKYGYTAEIHNVTTEDGYIITLHRISGAPKSPPRKGKRVCFLNHGIMDSSAGWVMMGPNKALGFILADQGFDVWLANCRGNAYSTKHTVHSPYSIFPTKRKQYWSFSFHEIGYYDLPAFIDYVLDKTEQKKLQYIAHSQGTTTFFVMISERPEYNEKIEMMHAIAPVAFLSNIYSPPLQALVVCLPVLKKLGSLIGVHFIPPTTCIWPLGGWSLGGWSPVQMIMKHIILAIVGYKSDQMHSTPMQLFMGHLPAGCSVDQLYHYGQLIKTGRFQKYNPEYFDYTSNSSISPPDYNLSNVKTPVALYYSDEDWLAVDADIQILKGELPNVVKDYPIIHKKFNHIDFLCGVDAPRILYDEIIKTMKENDQMTSQQVDI